MSVGKVYEDLCYSEVRIERIKFVWKVRDFSKIGSRVSSSTFPSSAPEDVGKWILEMDVNYGVIRVKQETDTVKSAKIKISLINDKGDARGVNIEEYKKGYGCSGSVPDRWNLPRDLLPNDELTIVCQIDITFSRVNRPHDSASAKCEPPPCRLAEDLGMLLSSQSLSDVTIVVRDVKLKAHKNILAARSPVFAAMFSNQMLEKETGVVEITDMDADVVQAMLEFIYTGKDVSQKSWAHDLLAAANKYQLEGLKFMCEEALGKALTVDNVLEHLTMADLYSAARLKELCISFVMAHRDDVKLACDILKRSEKSIVSENSLSN